MVLSIGSLIVWIIVGALAGAAAASVMYRGRGRVTIVNTIIGMVGALIGGFLFDLLRIQIGTLAAIQINAQDLLAAFLGALILLFIARALRRG